MEAKECKQCGKTFTPKYEWSTMCWGCWWDSPAGKKWKAQKEEQENNFDRARAYDRQRERQEEPHNSQGFWGDRDGRQEQQRHRESFRDAFRGGNDSGVVGLDKMMLRKLLQLCHPDKHGGSALATSVTAELLKMKDRL